MNSVVGKAADVLTEVIKGAASGALTGAIDTGAKLAGVGQNSRSKPVASATKSKKPTSNNAASANKKTKTGK